MDFFEDDGFANGVLPGKIVEHHQRNRDYIVYRYRWWYENTAAAQYSRSFRIEDYGSKEAAIRAAEREQKRHCEEANIRRNDYRIIDDDIVEMKLCLFTANVPSMDHVMFDLADLELVKTKIWYHDELKGAVFCDKGVRRGMGAYIHYNGTIPRRVRQQFLYKDRNWRNLCRANLQSPLHRPVCARLHAIYTDLRNGNHPDTIGVEDNTHKCYKLHWSERGHPLQKRFSFKRQTREEARNEMKRFILDHVSELLGDPGDESDEDIFHIPDDDDDSDNGEDLAYLKYVED